MDKIDLIKTTSTYQKVVDDFHKGALSHCSLLLSPDKMSRQLFSTAFATLVICDDKNQIVADNIEKRIHPDVFFLPKNSDSLKVEDVEFVLERLNYFPIEADCKVFILENFSSSTIQAQNKLLKTLEETPQNVYFLLCSEKEDGILPTIKSRCRTLELEPLSESVLNILLSENALDAKTMEIAKFFGRGEMGRIKMAIKNPEITDMVNLSFDIIKNCKSSKDILGYTLKINQFRNNLLLFVQIFADIVQEILHIKLLGKNDYKILDFESLKNELQVDAILELQTKLIKIIEMADRFCNSTLIIDDILIQTCKALNYKG